MSSLNLCQFIGNVGKDPEIRSSKSGNAVASFSLACSDKRKDQNGDYTDSTEWVNCTAFGKTAELIESYVSKGSQVYISGRMSTDKWEDKEGNTRYTTKILVNDIKFLSKKKEDSRSDNDTSGSKESSSKGYSSDDGDEDLPF